MRTLKFILPLLALLFPALALAGTQSYTTPGTYTFTVPNYTGSLTVTASGGGGGGGSQTWCWGCAMVPTAPSGSPGGNSQFQSVTAYGGAGGQGTQLPSGFTGQDGANGGASGGDTNTTGGGASGGAGWDGSTPPSTTFAPPSHSPFGWHGGAGGRGGYVSKTYGASSLTPGSQVTVTVGAGGKGGGEYLHYLDQSIWWGGAPGSDGSLAISWTDGSSLSCFITFDQNPLGSGGGGTPGGSCVANGTTYTSGAIINICLFQGVQTCNVGSHQMPRVQCSAGQWVYHDGLASPPPGGTYMCASSVSPGGYSWSPTPCGTTDSTTMHWTSTGADLFYINSVGYVGSSGQAQVSSPGDYSGTVSGAGGTASCPATLADGNGTGGQCTPTSQTCNPSTGNLVDNCGQTTACQFGCSTQTNTCNLSCQPRNVCNANATKVVNSCTGSTVEDCAAQGKYCAGGQCIFPVISFISFDAFDKNGNPFKATGHLQAFPVLVHQGDTSRIYWNASNAKSCTVTGNNGDVWGALSSGANGKVTGPITAQTIYTLLCQALPGARPSSIEESVTVNILPKFNEQ